MNKYNITASGSNFSVKAERLVIDKKTGYIVFYVKTKIVAVAPVGSIVTC